MFAISALSMTLARDLIADCKVKQISVFPSFSFTYFFFLAGGGMESVPEVSAACLGVWRMWKQGCK